MRESGKMLATVLALLSKKLEPGQSTKHLDDIARAELKALGAEAAFLGYQGYPATLCVSVNDEIVHGMPRPDKIIEEGDIVSLDFGVSYKGMITDSAISVIAGNSAKPEHTKLLAATQESMHAGIKQVKDGVKTGDIGAGVEAVLNKGGYGVVRDLVGHGVGHYVHEDPNIPNYGRKGSGDRLKAGMTIAIEPMATLGGYGVKIDPDGWTIRTQDGSFAAHFEHTVLITEAGFEIITKL
jgi:methionyl aminopeptidase